MKIFLDVETTGLDPGEDHRIVELGLVTSEGEEKQWYFNPGRQVTAEAVKIHGITNDKLRKEPKFKDRAREILGILADATLVAHNADFDLSFLNHELKLAGLGRLENSVEDTLAMAQKKYPGEKHSLDALCAKFRIPTKRSHHGALIDARLLRRVYDCLILLEKEQEELGQNASTQDQDVDFPRRPQFSPSREELALHKKELMAKIPNSLWYSP